MRATGEVMFQESRVLCTKVKKMIKLLAVLGKLIFFAGKAISSRIILLI